MRTGGIDGRDQQEKNVGQFTIQRIKMDAFFADRQRRDQLVGGLRLAVRDGNTLTDGGGTQGLAGQQDINDLCLVLLVDGPRLRQKADHFGDHFRFGRCVQVTGHRVTAKEIADLHKISKSGAADRARTGDIHLGKVAFYQLNYRCIIPSERTCPWWAEKGSNLHGLPHMLLRHARLPISPSAPRAKLTANQIVN